MENNMSLDKFSILYKHSSTAYIKRVQATHASMDMVIFDL